MSFVTPETINQKIDQWESELKNPLWYEKVMPEIVELWRQEFSEEEKDILREKVYGFFEDRLYSGKLAIGLEGVNFDQWRKPIDTVVIHYTGDPKGGVSWKRLSTIGFLRQYAHDFWRYDDVYGVPTRGTAIWSNHFREVDGEKVPVFYAYHWIVRKDGSFERLLNDNEIGWQAGNGDINFRSVAIVLDGEFVESVPPSEMIGGIREIIKKNYVNVEKKRIFGHREVNPKTICPGNKFLGEWKLKLLE